MGRRAFEFYGAMNQSEGAFREGGKGLTTVDMIPHGEHRMAVKLGLEKRFQLRDDEFYPSHEAIFFIALVLKIVIIVKISP